MGGAIALTRRYAGLHLGVPGHTGLLWMLLLVGSRALVRRDGAATLVGASTALWSVPLGIGQGLPYNLALYATAGLALDILVRVFRLNLAHPVGGSLGGALAHAAKFGFTLGYSSLFGVLKHFSVVGALTALEYHLLFGAAGGLAAGLALWKGAKKRDK